MVLLSQFGQIGCAFAVLMGGNIKRVREKVKNIIKLAMLRWLTHETKSNEFRLAVCEEYVRMFGIGK